MKHAMAADRAEEDWRRPRAAENLDRRVDLADVDEPPRTQLETRESFPVPFHRHVVVDAGRHRSEEHTSELQSQSNLVCRLLLEKKKKKKKKQNNRNKKQNE